MAPIPIAHAPSPSAPRRLATNPSTIPAAPKRIGITNSDKIDNAKAAQPIPVPALVPAPEPFFDFCWDDGRVIGTGAAISAAVSSLYSEEFVPALVPVPAPEPFFDFPGTMVGLQALQFQWLFLLYIPKSYLYYFG